MSLDDLERTLRRQLDVFAYPERDWVVARGDANHPVLDVLIVGGGMAGLAIAIGLARERITRILVVDRNPVAQEGPWVTFARMKTLRTAKQLTGPDVAIESLTFRSWFEAQFGAEAFTHLHLADKDQWMDYLVWLRKVMNVPVRNDTWVENVEPDDGLLRVQVASAGVHEVLRARRVVLAGGYEGHGAPRLLDCVARLPRRFWAHTADAIDFAALQGKRVGVLGAGASAFDNSATALEAGAAEVVQFMRRTEMPKINWMRYAEFAGYFRGYPELDDERKVRFTQRCFDLPTPPPQETLERTLRHANFSLRMASGWSDARVAGDQVIVTTPQGEAAAFDFLILGLGYEVNLALRPELRALMPSIALWSDRMPAAKALARLPYLGRGFECLPKHAASPREVQQVYVIGPAALPSLGPICSGLNGMPFAIPRLVQAISRSFFIEDADRYHADFVAFTQAETDYAAALAKVAHSRREQ